MNIINKECNNGVNNDVCNDVYVYDSSALISGLHTEITRDTTDNITIGEYGRLIYQ